MRGRAFSNSIAGRRLRTKAALGQPTSDSVINSVSCTTATGGNFCLALGESTGKTLVEKDS